MSGLQTQPLYQLAGDSGFNVGQDQFLRAWSVVVKGNSGSETLTDSTQAIAADNYPPEGLRVRFQVFAMDATTITPGYAIIRVYNMSESHQQYVINEYNEVILQAGYQQGQYGQIFHGQIKQYKRGHENQTDSYLDIYASDWDTVHTLSTMNITQTGKNSAENRREEIFKAMTGQGAQKGYFDPNTNGGVLPRGRVFYGMAKDEMNAWCADRNMIWGIYGGLVQVYSADGYVPGTVIELNARSGMIGWPEATNEGVLVTCLLNPGLHVGNLVHINNSDINRFNTPGGGQPDFNSGATFPGFTNLLAVADVTADGMYRIFVIEYEGDTRGGPGAPWYANLVCLAVSAPGGFGGINPRASGKVLSSAPQIFAP